VKAGLRGIHATAVGLVFTAVYRLFEIGYLDSEVQDGGSLGRDPWWVVIIATTYVGGMHFKVPPPLAIVLGAVMGLIWYGVVRA
jgi:chromate transport protein ChrA